MDAMTYWKKHGRERVEQLCRDVGTSYNYWKHIANKRKRPSVDLALLMVEHSGGELTFNELLLPKREMRISKED
jgi:hypothetical protein